MSRGHRDKIIPERSSTRWAIRELMNIYSFLSTIELIPEETLKEMAEELEEYGSNPDALGVFERSWIKSTAELIRRTIAKKERINADVSAL